MTNNKGTPGRFSTNGYQPTAATPKPGGVQGGYQAPAGGGKPAAPTTGSGVGKTK